MEVKNMGDIACSFCSKNPTIIVTDGYNYTLQIALRDYVFRQKCEDFGLFLYAMDKNKWKKVCKIMGKFVWENRVPIQIAREFLEDAIENLKNEELMRRIDIPMSRRKKALKRAEGFLEVLEKEAGSYE